MDYQNTLHSSSIEVMEELNENEMSYHGPFGNAMSDNLLSMTNLFLQEYFEGESVKMVKGVFSTFVELTQNIADYYEKYFVKLPSCSIQLKVEQSQVFIKTSNYIRVSDVENIRNLFSKTFSLEGEDLKNAHKQAILNGNSLGLLMIRKMQDAEFNWEIDQQDEEKPTLTIELKISYGATNN